MLTKAGDIGARLIAKFAARCPAVLPLLPRLPTGIRRRLVEALEGAALPQVQVRRFSLTLSLDLADDVQRAVYLGVYDHEELGMVQSVVGPNATCLDVGANVGLYTCLMAKSVGPNGRVYAFEPEPRNIERLNQNLKLNLLADRVTVLDQAVAAHSDGVTFFRHGSTHSGWGGIHRHPNHEAELKVPSVSLDAFLDAERIDEVDLLKIDVEGAELEVLSGAVESLDAGRFRYIMSEYNGFWLSRLGRSRQEFFEILESAGYEPRWLNVQQYLALKSGQADPDQVINLLFERRSAPPGGA